MRYISEKTRMTNKYLSTKQKIYRYVCLVFVYYMCTSPSVGLFSLSANLSNTYKRLELRVLDWVLSKRIVIRRTEAT
jgi:hypothetical protein